METVDPSLTPEAREVRRVLFPFTPTGRSRRLRGKEIQSLCCNSNEERARRYVDAFTVPEGPARAPGNADRCFRVGDDDEELKLREYGEKAGGPSGV